MHSNKPSIKIRPSHVHKEILRMKEGKYYPNITPDEMITAAILKIASKDKKWLLLTEEQKNHITHLQATKIIHSDPNKQQHQLDKKLVKDPSLAELEKEFEKFHSEMKKCRELFDIALKKRKIENGTTRDLDFEQSAIEFHKNSRLYIHKILNLEKKGLKLDPALKSGYKKILSTAKQSRLVKIKLDKEIKKRDGYEKTKKEEPFFERDGKTKENKLDFEIEKINKERDTRINDLNKKRNELQGKWSFFLKNGMTKECNECVEQDNKISDEIFKEIKLSGDKIHVLIKDYYSEEKRKISLLKSLLTDGHEKLPDMNNSVEVFWQDVGKFIEDSKKRTDQINSIIENICGNSPLTTRGGIIEKCLAGLSTEEPLNKEICNQKIKKVLKKNNIED